MDVLKSCLAVVAFKYDGSNGLVVEVLLLDVLSQQLYQILVVCLGFRGKLAAVEGTYIQILQALV